MRFVGLSAKIKGEDWSRERWESNEFPTLGSRVKARTAEDETLREQLGYYELALDDPTQQTIRTFFHTVPQGEIPARRFPDVPDDEPHTFDDELYSQLLLGASWDEQDIDLDE